MSVDLPPPYSEKSKDQPQDGRGYFVAISHGRLFTSKEKLPSNGRGTRCKVTENIGIDPEGFQFIQPIRMRSLGKCFTLPIDGIRNCDHLSSNFTYNLWYFQMNYAVLFVMMVLMAMQQIHCHQFTLEVYVTVAVMAIVYIMNNLGCKAKALGRKVKLSEQFTAIITIMVLYNGFLPQAFDFIYFFSGYIFFVAIHASVIQAGKPYLTKAAVHHI